MKEKIEILEEKNLPENVDSEHFIRVLKVPYTVSDDFGNETVLYKKEQYSLFNLRNQLKAARKVVDEIQSKIDAIDSK